MKNLSRPAHGAEIRRRRSASSRTAILRAAERIFAEEGLAGARTDAIAGQAGVNKALLYYYFRSKDDIFRAVVEEHLKDFHRQVSEVLGARGSAPAVLLSYVSAHFDFISARPYYPRLLHRLLMADERRLKRLVTRRFLPIYRKLARVIERGIRAGELRRVDSHQAVLSLVALVVFYFSTAPVAKLVMRIDPYDPARLARRKREVLDFIRHGLFLEQEAGRR